MALLGYLVIMFIVSSTGCGQQEVLGAENMELVRTTSTQFWDTVTVSQTASEAPPLLGQSFFL